MRAAVPAVLVPRRHPEPRRAGDARLDPRGRRARLRARARLRRRVRQPRPGRLLRRRRRRGGDRPARRELALEQVPRPGARRRGAADPAPQRLQDRQPDGARAHPRGRAARAARGLRPRAALRRRATTPTAVHQAMAAALDGALDEIRAIQDARAQRRRGRAAALADDRAAHAEGLDRARRGRRRAGRGHVARAPGAARRARRRTRSTCAMLEEWMRSYRPEELFDERRPAGRERRSRWRPTGDARMGANPHANGGVLLRDLELPDFRDYAVDVPAPGATLERGDARARRLPARRHAREPARRSASSAPTRPRRTGSARVFEATDRAWMAELRAGRRPPRAATGA